MVPRDNGGPPSDPSPDAATRPKLVGVRQSLSGTNLYEIGVAIVAIAVAMLIGFCAVWLGFGPN
jgi:hypothetical protein